MCAYMHICVHICVYARMYAYMRAYMHICEHISICAYMHIRAHICIYAHIYALLAYMHLCAPICMHVRIYASMLVFTDICAHICICIFVVPKIRGKSGGGWRGWREAGGGTNYDGFEGGNFNNISKNKCAFLGLTPKLFH